MATYTIETHVLPTDEANVDVHAAKVWILRDGEFLGSYAALLEARGFADLQGLVGGEDAARSALMWVAVHHAAELVQGGWPSPGEHVDESLTMSPQEIAGWASPLPGGDAPMLMEFDA